MIRRSKITVIFILLCVIVSSCTKRSCDNDVPAIVFSNFTQFSDNSAKLILNFKDCNGDIGLSQADTVDPFQFNLFMELFELQNGEWIKQTPLIPFYYRIPELTERGEEDVIEGDIEITMPSYFNPNSSYDTLRFEVFVMDKALNQSNTVVTRDIIKP